MSKASDFHMSRPPIFGLGRVILEYGLERACKSLDERGVLGRRLPGLVPIAALTTLLGLGTTGCSSAPPQMETVPTVELERFMGDWRVVALIPNRIEREAHDSVESYAMRDDGRIDITYTFRKGSFDGKAKKLTMVATPIDDTGARWKVRPFWPLSLDYRVIDLADDYRYTVIGHPSRNYLWIMAREAALADSDWQAIHARLEELGYDLDRIRKVPQEPTE